MRAEIITVGTEILLGDIVNTNTQYLARELAQMGIGIYRQTTVGDNEDRLLAAFEAAFCYSDVIITTGGLGPTQDDITKETAAKFFDQPLVVHEPSLKVVEAYFKNNPKAMANGNAKQTVFPESSIVLDNPNGTAPGCILQDGAGRYIIVLPGPPHEMEPMFEQKVRPFLETLTGNTIRSRILRFTGIGEWEMSGNVSDLQELTNPTVAPYAKNGECILRVTAMAEDEAACNELMDPVIAEIKRRMPLFYYGEGEETLQEIVPRLLIEKGLTMSCAESITGGLLASTIINSPLGISASFREGFITYSNDAKIRDLGVRPETLEQFGAVSGEVAREMVMGCQLKSGTDIAVSTTGLAGPGPDTESEPVGLTYVGIYYKGDVKVYRNIFTGRRNQLRGRVVRFVLEKLLRHMEADQ
ncbi:MAG: competence/damage-inducible protein A [Clostridiaceae bacterium]